MGKVKDYYWDEINREQEGPMENNDGGYVYPHDSSNARICNGITRRDWLAGMAMQGMLSRENILTDLDVNVNRRKTLKRVVAEWAYEYADSLIAEGRK